MYYNSPAKQLDAAQLEGLLKISRKVVVAGDFNATHVNWGCRRNNANGNTLNAFTMNSDALLYFPSEPTHIPANGTNPSTVDLVLAVNVKDIGDMNVETTSSDHAVVIFDLGEGAAVDVNITRNDYSKANWLLFRKIMNEQSVTHNINTVEELDKIVETFTNSITSAIKKTIPQKTINPYKFNELPPQIVAHIAERNRHRRLYQRTRDPLHHQQMKQYSRIIRQEIAEYRSTSYAKRLRGVNVKDGTVWKLNKHLRKKYSCINAIQNEDGTVLMRREDIAEIMADTFLKYHNTPSTDANTEGMVVHSLNTFLLQNPPHPHHSEPFLTTPRTVHALINRTPSTKAPGVDSIQNLVLKNLPRKSIVQLTTIINAISIQTLEKSSAS
ncbi:Endonuclease-reverse transcriptase [Popillia japonica]|uniref:Endonuclease-reverse transcriptase n=1 Tax=Popillia japonica TaxID=7064 RepID=A0AAW1JZ94_POPJA